VQPPDHPLRIKLLAALRALVVAFDHLTSSQQVDSERALWPNPNTLAGNFALIDDRPSGNNHQSLNSRAHILLGKLLVMCVCVDGICTWMVAVVFFALVVVVVEDETVS
jgi:hypothetical protein